MSRMKIVSWNVRGLGGASRRHAVGEGVLKEAKGVDVLEVEKKKIRSGIFCYVLEVDGDRDHKIIGCISFSKRETFPTCFHSHDNSSIL